MNIICTTAAEHIGKRLATDYGFNVIFPDKNREGKRCFPDGEVYSRISGIDNLRGRTIILHSGAPDPNAGLTELRMNLKILKKAKIKPEVFFTYFPYGKQDQEFVKGETNAAKDLVEELVNYYRVKRIYIIDVHFSQRRWLSEKKWFWFRKYPVINISVVDLLRQAALRDYPDLIFLTPDTGGQKRTGLAGTRKKRFDSYTIEIKSDEEFKAAVRGKRIGVIDDLLETGGTLAGFSEECTKYGALEAVALITHIVLPEGVQKIRSKYAKIYATNTINTGEANLDITAIVANVLSR